MGEVWCWNVLSAIEKDDSVTLDKLLKIAGKQRLNLRIRMTNYRFFTPVHDAVCFHKYEIVKQLLLAGATVNGPNKCGDTPLMHAVGSCDKEMCSLLLKHVVQYVDMDPLHPPYFFSNGYHRKGKNV